MAHHRRRKRKARPQPVFNRSTAAALLALAVPGTIQAQQSQPTAPAERTLREVRVEGAPDTYKADRVSSPKLPQPLVDTPQTITVIKKELLQEQAATTLSEALRNTPGITFLAGEGGNAAPTAGDSIFMRGFDTRGSIFVDNIRDLGEISRDIFNLEQVEISKGPASDNGRGAISGYVNLVTKVPQLENFSTGSVSYGSGDRKRATADLNRAFGQGSSSAFRLNLMWQDGGVAGRDEVKQDSWGIAPSLAFGLGTRTRTYFYLQHLEQDNRPDYGVPTVGFDGYFNATLAEAGISPERVDSKNYYGSLTDREKIWVDMFTARIEHDLSPGIKLQNVSRYGKSKREAVITSITGAIFAPTAAAPGVVTADPSTWLVNRSRQGNFRSNEILTNQTHVTAEFDTGPVKHSLSTGLEFIYEKQRTPAYAGFGTMSPANLYNPNPRDPISGFALAPTGAYTEGTTSTVALYAFDTLKLSDRWLLTAGARMDNYRVEFLGVSAATADPPLTATRLKVSDSVWSWKLGAVYKPAANGSIYAAYATSIKPPGGDNFALSSAANNINNPNMDPQKATNIEIGTKWNLLDDRLALAAALYRSENKNDAIATDAVTGAVLQFGKKRVQGIELSAVGQITPAWQISAGLATMNTKVVEGTATQVDSSIQWSPKLTATLWSTYKLPFGLTIGGGARYVSTQQRSTSNAVTATTNMPEVPSYLVLDAMASYQVNKNLTVQLNLFNLTDKLYMIKLNNNGQRYVPGTPRAAMLTANLSF